MATLNASAPTLFDLALMPENASVADIINPLVEANPMLEDAPAYAANKGTYHETTIMTGLPEVFWGRVYKGIPATKGTRQLVKETMGFLESAAQVDARIVDTFEDAMDKASIRMSEASGHLESMAQKAASALLYSDIRTSPDEIMGLSPRFSDFAAENGKQIIEGGGTGNDLTSIWMITWHESTVHLIYPKKGTVGVERNDLGKIHVPDENGNLYQVYREEFRWYIGISVRDWRYVSRIANIKTSALTVDAATGADIIELMTAMYYAHLGRRQSKGKTVIYANTTIVMFLDYQARLAKDKNLFLTFQESGVNAKEILHFRGIPIRESDGILDTEEEVV